MRMKLVTAKNEDKERVLHLYDSVRGKRFCNWGEDYPVMREIDADTAAGLLYLFTDGESLIGALSVESENELDGQTFWKCPRGAKEIARVVVAPEYQGRGIAARMMEMIEEKMKKEGACAIHLLANVSNVPACKTYEKAGFSFRGRTEMYGGEYYACEKLLR